jgi:hypothetical protein
MRNLTTALAALFLTVLGGLLLLFTYKALLIGEVPHAWILVAAGYLVLGTAMGCLAGNSVLGIRGRLSLIVLLLVASMAFTTFMLPPFLAALEAPPLGGVHAYLVLIWPAVAALGFTVCGFRSIARSAADAASQEHRRIPDKQAHAFAIRHGLLVEGKALADLRSRPAGLECRICCADHGDASDNWLFQWLRCPRMDDHLFHAWHFRDEQWRCPVCRAPIYADDV